MCHRMKVLQAAPSFRTTSNNFNAFYSIVMAMLAISSGTVVYSHQVRNS